MDKQEALDFIREICPFTYVELHGEERQLVLLSTDMVEPDHVSMSLHCLTYYYITETEHYEISWPMGSSSDTDAMVFRVIAN